MTGQRIEPQKSLRVIIHYPWIELVRRPQRKDRNFAGKVHAFNDGFAQVQDLQVELIGNLDADISFGPDHFEFLLARFVEDPALGVAGTAYTQQDWDSTRDSFEGQTSVHGACQLFRLNAFRRSAGISQAALVELIGWLLPPQG